MQQRWDEGRNDARITLEASPWLLPMAQEEGARTFDVLLDLAKRSVPAG